MKNGLIKGPPILIATLGSEPQVVTAACDLLLQRGEDIGKAIVIHTSASGTPIEAAVETLRAAFDQPPYLGKIPLTMVPLSDEANRPLADVDSPASARNAFIEIYRQVRQAKLAGLRVHLSIAGGRKSMAVFGMAAAQLLFDESDCLWHLFSSGDFLASKRLHPRSGDEAYLVEIPVILWSQVSPVLTDMSQDDDPFAAIERIRQLHLNEKLEQARSFVLGALTPAEGRVVELLVREGMSDQEIAERLSLSPRTVEGQLRSAYLKAANHWELPDVGRAQLISLLNMYYSIRMGAVRNAGFSA